MLENIQSDGMGWGWISSFENKNTFQLFEFLQLSWEIPDSHFMFFEDIEPCFSGSGKTDLKDLSARVFSKTFDCWDSEISRNNFF